MGFNVPNWGFIVGGQTMTVGYTFGESPPSRGAQFAQGFPEDSANTLLVNNESIFFDSTNSQITYQFDLTCFGNGTRFELDGGGLS